MRFAASVFTAFALTCTAAAQVIGIDDLLPTTGTSNSIPWNQAGGYTSLHVYSAAALLSRGICPGATLTDLAVAPSGGTTGTYNAPTAQVQIGHLTVSPPVPGAWTTHLATPIVVHSLTSGPYTFPWTLNTYASLPGFATSGFVWDGIRDVGIQMTTSAGVTGGFNARRTATQLRHGINVFGAVAQLPLTNGLFAMEVRLTFTPGTTLYDTNTAAASLDVNGLQGSPCSATNSLLCVGNTVNLNVNTTQVGLGYELAYNFAALVPLGGGATPVGTQGILNVDLAAPTLFLNGGVGPVLAPSPGPFTISFPMPALPAPGLSAQYFQISPGSADGFELSQGCNLQSIAGATSIPGPVGDDIALSITANTGPNCFPPIALYGTTYTQYHVITNGRVTVGPTANTSFGAAAVYGATEPSFAGFHADFNTAVGGTITINNTGTSVQVVYSGIGYFGQTGTASTWTMDLYPNSDVTFSGVTMGAPTALRNCFMGVHPGGAATIEAGFPTTYVGTGTFMSALAGNSHGAFGDLFTALLTDPADTLAFTYNGLGGYNVSY